MMLKKFYKTLKKQEGFTLVELMVVVVIIGVLVGIAVPIYNSTTTTAKTNTCKANERIILGAIETAAANGNNKADIDSIDYLVTNNFLQDAPTCPVDDSGYEIEDGVLTSHFTDGAHK